MDPTLKLVTKLMLCDIKFIPVQQDCLLTLMYISKHIYIDSKPMCSAHLVYFYVWSTSTLIVFPLTCNSNLADALGCNQWLLVVCYKLDIYMSCFIRVKETKIQACHSSCPCHNNSMHLSMLSPTIPHPGYSGAIQGDLMPTNCPKGIEF